MLSEKPWDLGATIRLFAAVIGTLAFGILLTGLVEGIGTAEQRRFLQMIITGVAFQGGALVWIWIFLKGANASWQDAFGFGNGSTLRVIALGLAAGILVLPFLWSMQWACEQLMRLANLNPDPQEVVKELSREGLGFGQKLYFGTLSVLVAPIAEESLFRGVLYPSIKYAGASRLFSSGDFREFSSFCARMCDGTNAVAQYLTKRFSESTQLALIRFKNGDSDSNSIRETVLNDLNSVLLGPPIYEEERFAGVTLDKETRRLLERNPQTEDELIRLNRILLEDAFPTEFSKKRSGHPYLALWATSLLFGLFHLNTVTFLPLTVFGVILILLYEKTNNLLAPIFAHSLFNSVNFLILIYQEELSQWVNVK